LQHPSATKSGAGQARGSPGFRSAQAGLLTDGRGDRHFVGIADNVFRFSPVRATNDDLPRFHGTNERISLANYAEMIRFYGRADAQRRGAVTIRTAMVSDIMFAP
jgi:hypothetical protein